MTEVFEAMVGERAFHVAELGMSYFLRTMDFDDPPFLAIPVFLNRCFRHSAIYINVNSGIRKPEDLAGKTVGEFAMYGHDAGVWPKGILSDDFGVKPEQCRWVIGALDWPLKPIDFVPQPHPAGIDIKTALKGADLGAMLYVCGLGLRRETSHLHSSIMRRRGVGPFLVTFLAASLRWTPDRIGMVMFASGIIGLFAQAPCGALVDQLKPKRLIVALSSALIACAEISA